MEYKKFDETMSTMLDKIGNDSAQIILDDVAVLLTDNQNMNEELKNKDSEIQKLKDLNSRLQNVNSNLLMQIPIHKEDNKNQDEEKNRTKSYSINEAFDEYGNFKK